MLEKSIDDDVKVRQLAEASLDRLEGQGYAKITQEQREEGKLENAGRWKNKMATRLAASSWALKASSPVLRDASITSPAVRNDRGKGVRNAKERRLLQNGKRSEPSPGGV